MNPGYKHFSRWNFGDCLWHKVTGDKGMVVSIELWPNTPAAYCIIFEDSRDEQVCAEFELTDEMPVGKTG